MLKMGAGTASFYKFYDLVNGKKSVVYENIIFLYHDKILYTDLIEDEWHLILSSIFDNTVYSETTIDLASATGCVEKAVFDEIHLSVFVTYISEENYKEKQISIPLN